MAKIIKKDWDFKKTLKLALAGVGVYIACIAAFVLACLGVIGFLLYYFITSPLVQNWLGYQ